MKCRRQTIISLVLVAVCGLSLAYATVLKLRESEKTTSKEHQAFDGFCRLTVVGVQSDMFDLRSDDAKRRERAYSRIYNEQIFHGDLSVRECLGDKMPSSEPWDWCLINEDFKCLGDRSEMLHKRLEQGE